MKRPFDSNLNNWEEIKNATGAELQNCPFCGEKRDLQILSMDAIVNFSCSYLCEKQKDEITELHHCWQVNCPSCGCMGGEGYVHTPKHLQRLRDNGFEFLAKEKTDEEAIMEAIEKWNRRV